MIESRWCTCGHNSRDHGRGKPRACLFVVATHPGVRTLCSCGGFTPKEIRESGYPAGRAPEVVG